MNNTTEFKHAKTKSKKSKIKKIIIAFLAVIAVLFIGGLAAVPMLVMPSFLGQRYEQEQYVSADFGIESERITLTTDDSLKLAAWRTFAEAEDRKGTVIILSGIQNPSVTAFFGYAKMLADAGWDSLLIEMRARSESEGEEIGLGMTEWRDVKAGVDFLAADAGVKELPIVTMGTSLGGGTVLIAAGEIPEVDAVISISGFSSWSDLFRDYMAMYGIPREIATMDLPFVNLYLGFHFGFDALKYSPVNGIAKLGGRPVLLMHSTEDTQVPFGQYEKLLNKAAEKELDVSTFVREGDEHFVCYDRYFEEPLQDAEFSGAVLDFLAQYFP